MILLFINFSQLGKKNALSGLEAINSVELLKTKFVSVDEHGPSFLSTNFLIAPVFETGNFLNCWSWVPLLYSEKPVPDSDPCESWLLWKLQMHWNAAATVTERGLLWNGIPLDLTGGTRTESFDSDLDLAFSLNYLRISSQRGCCLWFCGSLLSCD